jgi:hypothetical protein
MTDAPIPFVILSGSYCTAEIASEYGKLPPSFLPVANRRLYELQIGLARQCHATPVLTLPADYAIPPVDQAALAASGVRVVRSPVSLSLTEAVQFVLEVIDAHGPMHLLFGDTLVEIEDSVGTDRLAVHQTEGYYNWAYIVSQPDGSFKVKSGYGDGVEPRSVVCGYFAFADADELRRAFVAESGFAEGINAYLAARPMQAVDIATWHDFGHLALIYQSKRNMLVSRSFNSVASDGVAVVKTSSAVGKMNAEASWYEAIPPDLRVFTPQYLGRLPDGTGYRIEYLYLPNLAELYVFGDLPGNIWKSILSKCIDFIDKFRRVKPDRNSNFATEAFARQFYENMFVAKTRERIGAFLGARGWPADIRLSVNGHVFPPLDDVFDRLFAAITPTTADDICLWHGDFFFGNMLYDFRAGRIKAIDPRGGDASNSNAIYGDWRYDVAKLAHSIVGGYDTLLAGRVDFSGDPVEGFRFERERSKSQEAVERDFRAARLGRAPLYTREIQAMTSLMFLTMLPLHADSARRQDIMLCNGLLLALDLM